MTEHDYTPIYKYEDKTTSFHIDKPHIGDGAFIAVDGNVHFAFSNSQYDDILLPLLKAIIEEKNDGAFQFFKCQDGDYCLRGFPISLTMDNQSGIALQKHAQKILDVYDTY